MEIQISKIIKKMESLKKKDTQFAIFGSETHQYKLNKTKSENELLEFEERYGIKLPYGYREFLKRVGNGGAGPYYGLEPLENSMSDDLDRPTDNEWIDPSKPFKFVEAWNENEETDFNEEEYFSKELMNGALKISNFGCGISLILVVNGAEYGNIWVDDRGNDQGIYPDPYFKNNGRINFLDWYEYWLNTSLKEINIDKLVNFSMEESIKSRFLKFIKGIRKK